MLPKKERFDAKELPKNISLNQLLPRQLNAISSINPGEQEIILEDTDININSTSLIYRQLTKILSKEIPKELNGLDIVNIYDLGFKSNVYIGSSDVPMKEISKNQKPNTYTEDRIILNQLIKSFEERPASKPKPKPKKEFEKKVEIVKDSGFNIFEEAGSDYEVTKQLSGKTLDLNIKKEKDIVLDLPYVLNSKLSNSIQNSHLKSYKNIESSSEDEFMFPERVEKEEEDNDGEYYGYSSEDEEEVKKEKFNISKEFQKLDKIYASKYGESLKEEKDDKYDKSADIAAGSKAKPGKRKEHSGNSQARKKRM